MASRAVDLYYSYRFLKIMTTPWNKMEAFEHGIVDEKGKLLIKVKDQSSEQLKHFTTFHRLVFNIKRILEKIPFGRSKIGSYAAALFLLKEETDMSEDAILDVLKRMEIDFTLEESVNTMFAGQYILSEDAFGDNKGVPITLEDTTPVGTFAGVQIFKTKENFYITENNIVHSH